MARPSACSYARDALRVGVDITTLQAAGMERGVLVDVPARDVQSSGGDSARLQMHCERPGRPVRGQSGGRGKATHVTQGNSGFAIVCYPSPRAGAEVRPRAY